MAHVCKKCNLEKTLYNTSKRNYYICKSCKKESGRLYNAKPEQKEKRRLYRTFKRKTDKEFRKKEVQLNNLYRLKRAKTDVNFKLKINLRNRLNLSIKRNTKLGSGVRDLGCSVPEFKLYIESKFQPGMNWENWSINGWHLDHIRPLSSFDLSNKEELKKACHFTNLQPLWAKDNMKKGSKVA